MQVAELFKIKPTSGLGDLLKLNNSLDEREDGPTAAAAMERRQENVTF